MVSSLLGCVEMTQFHSSYLAHHNPHTGFILARQQQYSVGEYIRRLLDLMAHLTAEEMPNRVDSLRAWGEMG
jgi:hypothetical protein